MCLLLTGFGVPGTAWHRLTAGGGSSPSARPAGPSSDWKRDPGGKVLRDARTLAGPGASRNSMVKWMHAKGATSGQMYATAAAHFVAVTVM